MPRMDLSHMRRRRFDGPLYRCIARQRYGTRKVWALDEDDSGAPAFIGTSSWERGGVALSRADVVSALNFPGGSWDVDPNWRRP